MRLPRRIHVVWVGNASLCPHNYIATWRERNPSWTLRLWTDADLRTRTWRTRRHMTALYGRELCGVADLMRYEILLSEGGFAIDADSACVRPLDDSLFEGGSVFACWANERVRPGVLANGFMAAEKGDAFVARLVNTLAARRTVVDRPAWQAVGPMPLTETYNATRYPGFRAWPSHYFIPEHLSGVRYRGPGPVYAEHRWGSTKNLYGKLHREPPPR